MNRKKSLTIQGVFVKELVRHCDQRGFFSEIVQISDKIFRSNFAQLSHSMAKKGVLKAWHLHHKQTDWMYVATGDIKLGLFDMRKTSNTYGNLMEVFLGDTYGYKIVKVPPGVAHGYKVSKGPMHIIYLMDKEYDPLDIVKFPSNDARFNYNWNS